jgi:hypothetical protein
MDTYTVLTHGLTYLAALALPLWLLGEQFAAWWTFRKPRIDTLDRKAHLETSDPMSDEAAGARKAA